LTLTQGQGSTVAICTTCRAAWRVAELLDRFNLVGAARRPASGYSGGMRRRLDLAMTLVGDPRVVFLDEPTTGRLVPGGHLRVDLADERALAATAVGYPDATTDTDTLILRIPSAGSLRSMRTVLDALDERAVATVSLHTTLLAVRFVGHDGVSRRVGAC